jgi:hypothetical protein
MVANSTNYIMVHRRHTGEIHFRQGHPAAIAVAQVIDDF